MHEWPLANIDPATGLLAVAVALLYVAARALADALTGGRAGSPGLRAIGHWLPIAAVALAAMAMGQRDVAVRLVFSTSVIAVSLVLGAIVLTRPPAPGHSAARRRWGLLAPVAAMALLAGFHARMTGFTAMVFLAEGLAIVLWWMRPGDGAAPGSSPNPALAGRAIGLRWAQGLLAGALALIGAWAAVAGVTAPGPLGRVDPAMRAALILAPGVCIAMVGVGVQLAQERRTEEAIGAQVGVALLNLCLLLPLLIGMSYVMDAVAPGDGGVAAVTLQAATTHPAMTIPATTHPAATIPATTLPATTRAATATTASPARPAGLPFPMLAWRIDTALLLAIGMMLIPAAMGRRMPGRIEGGMLIAFFAAYLLALTMFHAMR